MYVPYGQSVELFNCSQVVHIATTLLQGLKSEWYTGRYVSIHV